MGWITAITLLAVGLAGENDILIVTSGLFAIAGSINFVRWDLKKLFEKFKQ